MPFNGVFTASFNQIQDAWVPKGLPKAKPTVTHCACHTACAAAAGQPVLAAASTHTKAAHMLVQLAQTLPNEKSGKGVSL
jgi:hypothetical protein